MTVAAATPGPLRWYTAAIGVVAFGVLGYAAADLVGRLLFDLGAGRLGLLIVRADVVDENVEPHGLGS